MRSVQCTPAGFLGASTLVVAISFAVIARAQAPDQKAPETVSIRGRVTAADGGQPLRNVQVSATLLREAPANITGLPASRSARTGADGTFEIGDLAPGRYTISAFKQSYVRANWGQSQPFETGKALELRAGQAVDDMNFALARGGVVTGHIVDEYGEPMSGVQVAAAQLRVINGKRDLVSTAVESTNDLGEFRLYGLTPGQYYVKANWRRLGTPMDGSTLDRTGYPETFFPGTTNAADAQRFTIRAGETVGDLAMAMTPIKT